ncbi:Cell fate regulator YmcA, YheA/YmcA/DUF963 family (controls sporulation, competence, biofilm development) [Marininema mesophilum]|uniref:Cell fate regulator YmcA, YheA/YmcA/DUF963 family (Controls sporulation, competence, biofilm development) n=1 Tax=Marininema mesophilum TaxID=1048340 RepID=A0A1H2ZEC1_9BACL|nr:YlbF family regulator [Marininema mesophilum]SDX15750.1 Cell fate regulator YmcA, YheA/YmcA/DUF963 family (controls sporulation, competence, biofilm development) [Marininema mesophilum]
MAMEMSDSHPALQYASLLGSKMLATEEIQRFRLAERQIQKSEKVNGMIAEIKRKQKELVHAKAYHKTEYIRQLEGELDTLQQEMESLPIVREYQQSQVEVNDLLQTIQKVVADVVSEKLEIEIGGETGGGCGSGGACGCN